MLNESLIQYNRSHAKCNCDECIMGTIVITSILSYLSFIIGSIYALCDISFEYQTNQCPDSYMWIYVLTTLITSIIVIFSSYYIIFKANNTHEQFACLILITIILVVLCVFGIRETYIDCNLDNTLLYKIGNVAIIINSIITPIVTSFVLFHLCMITWCCTNINDLYNN